MSTEEKKVASGAETPISSNPADEPAKVKEEEFEEYDGDIGALVREHYTPKVIWLNSKTFKKRLRFEVKPLDTKMYTDLVGRITKMLLDMNKKNTDLSETDIELYNYATHYAPIIERILPMCCVKPKFSTQKPVPEGAISLNKFPALDATELMLEIFKVSGLIDVEGSKALGNL